MSNPATDSLPIVRRSGYDPIPEEPFTGPTSILRRLSQARPVDLEAEVSAAQASWLGVAPPVSAEAVVAREDYRAPAPEHSEVELSDAALVEPRRLCECGHPHGLHVQLRRGERCSRCSDCVAFAPKDHELPATAEEARRSTLWREIAGYLIVGLVGAFCGAGIVLTYLMLRGVL